MHNTDQARLPGKVKADLGGAASLIIRRDPDWRLETHLLLKVLESVLVGEELNLKREKGCISLSGG